MRLPTQPKKPKQEGEEFNRIDKGTCLAVKTLARWIAAQPLYNGGLLDEEGNHTGISPLGEIDNRAGLAEYMTYDENRWKAVVSAAEEFMKLVEEGRYALYSEDGEDILENSGDKVYKRLEQMFRKNSFYQKEAILTLTNGKDTRWIQDNVPASFGSGQTRNQPTQEQVDMYEVIVLDTDKQQRAVPAFAVAKVAVIISIVGIVPRSFHKYTYSNLTACRLP